jgi:putative nucleotidyltransferase with HDIG domain
VDEEVIGVGLVVIDVTERTRSEEERDQLMRGAIAAIAATTEARDPYTAGHQRRVAEIAAAIADELGLSTSEVDGIRLGAGIHDIGKIGIPAEILARPAALSSIEWEMVKCHARTGYEIIADIEFPWPIASMILQHHERLDGSGYPDGLRGDEITLGARIIAVADTVEAMASHRPYRAALGLQAALNEIKEKSGTLFDFKVVDACLRIFDEGRFIFEENSPERRGLSTRNAR